MSGYITVVLLNWMRPDNMLRILDALDDQTERPTIFLWNNSGKHIRGNVDWQVDSSRNEFCMPRWWMAQWATTPYVMTLDDDLMPADNDLLSDLLHEVSSRAFSYDQIIGAFGKVLVKEEVYEKCPPAEPDHLCDIVLGRLMIMRTATLVRRMNWPAIQSAGEYRTVDDIIISALFARNRQLHHYCTGVTKDRLIELPDEFAVCREEGHFVRRENARRHWFSW